MKKDTHNVKEVKFEIVDVKWCNTVLVRIHWDDIAYQDFEISVGDSISVIPEMKINYSVV